AALGAGLTAAGFLVAATADRTGVGDGHDALVLAFADDAGCHARPAGAARADALSVLVGVEQRAGPRAQGARRGDEPRHAGVEGGVAELADAIAHPRSH